MEVSSAYLDAVGDRAMLLYAMTAGSEDREKRMKIDEQRAYIKHVITGRA